MIVMAEIAIVVVGRRARRWTVLMRVASDWYPGRGRKRVHLHPSGLDAADLRRAQCLAVPVSPAAFRL